MLEPNETLAKKFDKIKGKNKTGERISVYRACLHVNEAIEDR